MSVKCTTCDKSCSFRKEPFSSDYAALLARHNALKEAVAWERECDGCAEWLENFWFVPWGNRPDFWEITESCDAARYAVDRLIEGESSTDCKGEV